MFNSLFILNSFSILFYYIYFNLFYFTNFCFIFFQFFFIHTFFRKSKLLTGFTSAYNLLTCGVTCLTCSLWTSVMVVMSVPTQVSLVMFYLETTCDCTINDHRRQSLNVQRRMLVFLHDSLRRSLIEWLNSNDVKP